MHPRTEKEYLAKVDALEKRVLDLEARMDMLLGTIEKPKPKATRKAKKADQPLEILNGTLVPEGRPT